MQIYIVRHQQSVDNANQIIQGSKCDSSLTTKGQFDAQELANELKNKLSYKGVNQIISSPLERAAQTAQIIAHVLGVPVIYDSSLMEFNTGVLSGSKKSLGEIYPKYLEIWNQRGDLDGIPGAERGDELQARSIYFLERYMDSKDDLREIIVSHAGFNRCMINTARLNPRNKPVGHHYNFIHNISNPWETMNVKRFLLAKASECYKIETVDQTYVMKRILGRSQEDMKFQYEVSKHMAQLGEFFPEVLYWGIRNGHAIQVLRFLGGEHIFDNLTTGQTNNLIHTVYKLGQGLKTIPNNLESYCDTLNDKIQCCVGDLDNPPIKNVGLELLANQRYKYLVTKIPQVLVHYDLHRSNILFTKEGDVKILDLGSMAYSPDIFLPASFFISTFMLQQSDSFSLDKLISDWPEPLNKKDILILMQARAIIGASFFEKRISKKDYSKEDYDIYQRYLNSLRIINSISNDS